MTDPRNELCIRDLEDAVRRAELKLAKALGRDPDSELCSLTFLVAEAVEHIPRPPDYCRRCGREVEMQVYAPRWCSAACFDGKVSTDEATAVPVRLGWAYEAPTVASLTAPPACGAHPPEPCSAACCENIRDPYGVVIPDDRLAQQRRDLATVAGVADGIAR